MKTLINTNNVKSTFKKGGRFKTAGNFRVKLTGPKAR